MLVLVMAVREDAAGLSGTRRECFTRAAAGAAAWWYPPGGNPGAACPRLSVCSDMIGDHNGGDPALAACRDDPSAFASERKDGPMSQTAIQDGKIEAGDDGQRQLLRIALRDAMKAYEDVQASCGPCRAALAVLRACPEHQQQEDTFHARRHLYERLDQEAEVWTGRRAKEPYALSDTETGLIRSALVGAIAYRSTGTAAEDLALTAAYAELLADVDVGQQPNAAAPQLAPSAPGMVWPRPLA
jgi:hypothetical protein